ncbi:uncharacterized protein LOC129620936 isoform X2 [Bubalus kerabau]|uniref:uncharacterized protein LOC129620936 isoform X2 n=1 Tax=Bubalus carabanensis TaxID=3119969 RepID=UPI00244E8E25|nr:uncharacterized protein LOC129620936 isoform X2 [Bubalus carabanensis]
MSRGGSRGLVQSEGRHGPMWTDRGGLRPGPGCVSEKLVTVATSCPDQVPSTGHRPPWSRSPPCRSVRGPRPRMSVTETFTGGLSYDQRLQSRDSPWELGDRVTHGDLALEKQNAGLQGRGWWWQLTQWKESPVNPEKSAHLSHRQVLYYYCHLGRPSHLLCQQRQLTTSTMHLAQELLMDVQRSGGSRSFAKETRVLKMSTVAGHQKVTTSTILWLFSI